MSTHRTEREDADLALEALRSRPPRTDGGKHGATSSDLSVDEAILVHRTGYEPRGLVTGSCIFRPYAFGSWAPMSQSTELTAMSGAMHEARTIAMKRLPRRQAGSMPKGSWESASLSNPAHTSFALRPSAQGSRAAPITTVQGARRTPRGFSRAT